MAEDPEDPLPQWLTLELSKPKIDLSSQSLTDLDCLRITEFLYPSTAPLLFLHLGSNSISDEGLIALSLAIAQHPELQELYLGGNLFGSLGFRTLCGRLPPALVTLSLTGAMLQDEDVILLSEWLLSLHPSHLQHLYLNSNSLTDTGLQTLVYAPHRIPLTSGSLKIRTLHLGDNEFSAAGVVSLCEYLPDDTSLVSLFLSDNLLDEESTEVISQALIANSTLELLSMANCGLTDDTLSPILSAMAVNEKLHSLHLWGNSLTAHGVELLIETLKRHNHTLEDVLLFGNAIDNFEDISEVTDMQTVQRLLDQNISLRMIDDLPQGTGQDGDEKEFEELILSASKDDQLGIPEAPIDLEESHNLP